MLIKITNECDARFDIWEADKPASMLMINAHGMQDGCFVEPAIGGTPPLPEKEYAFTIPWDRALFNSHFKNNAVNITRYANTFKENANKMASRTPKLAIYPFVEEPEWIGVFNQAAFEADYDIAHFCDFFPLGSAESITLDQLLRAKHWSTGLTIADSYRSFLLLTCRSNTTRGIGFGGAQIAHPNGLYKADGLDPFIQIQL